MNNNSKPKTNRKPAGNAQGRTGRAPVAKHAQDNSRPSNRPEGRPAVRTQRPGPKSGPRPAAKPEKRTPAPRIAPEAKPVRTEDKRRVPQAPGRPGKVPRAPRAPKAPAPEPVFNKDELAQNNDPGSIHGPIESGAVIGRSAVRELLKGGRTIDKIYVQRGPREGSIVMLMGEANTRGIPVIEVDKARLDAMAGFVPHQGIIAMAAEKDYCTTAEILAAASKKNEPPLVVICDNISDPYNLGAIIRCADGAGAHGVIIPKRHSTGLTPLVTRASAGALEHMPVAKVTNIAQTVSDLQKSGVWVYAAEAGGTPYDQVDLTGSVAIVLGSEGDGVTNLVKKTCDGVISIPMYGLVNSFNVSTAAAVLLCEAGRQRHKPKTAKKH